MLSDVSSSGKLGLENAVATAPTESGEIYWFYVGFHLVLLVVAIVWRLLRGAPKVASASA